MGSPEEFIAHFGFSVLVLAAKIMMGMSSAAFIILLMFNIISAKCFKVVYKENLLYLFSGVFLFSFLVFLYATLKISV